MSLGSISKSKNQSNAMEFAKAKGRVVSKRLGSSKLASTSKVFKKDGKWKAILKKAGIFASLIFLFSILLGVLFLVGLISFYSKKLPNIDEYFAKRNAEGKDTIIVDRNNKELYRLQGDVIVERTTINDTPLKLQWAFMAAEDAEFKDHKGLNLYGLTRSLFCVARRRSSAGCGGGSSITQQVVKQSVDKYDDQTSANARKPDRKIKEAVLAMKVEQEYSKDQILEYYMNIVPEGGNLRGVKTGAHYIFGETDLNKLTLAQMAYLAGIPNSPSYFSPKGPFYNQDAAQERANYVLDRMLELKDKTGVTEDEVKQAKEDIPKLVFKGNDINKLAPHYVDYAIQKLSTMYADKVDANAKETGIDYVRGKGYTIKLAVDLDTQQLLEDTLKNGVDSAEFQRDIGAKNAAAYMMDPKTGEVLAMVGSKDYNGKQTPDGKFSPQYNVSVNPRSLGSTNKPFLDLSAFINGYNPSSIVPDIPLDMKASPDASTPKYEVRDYDGNFYSSNGRFTDPITKRSDFMTIRNALRWSFNVPHVATYYLATPEVYKDTYVKLTGWENFRGMVKGPSAPLGAANTPLARQVQGFATMGNMGMYNEEKVILQIKDDTGKIILDNTKTQGKQVIDKKYLYLINDMNKKYWLFDKDYNAADPLLKQIGQTMDIGGKTGTADTVAIYNPKTKKNEVGTGDVAFIAYTPTFALGMWAGNNCDPNSGGCLMEGAKPTGESLYKDLYKTFLQKYQAKIVPARFNDGVRPDGVQSVAICDATGKKASPKCPSGTHQEIVADAPQEEDMYQSVQVVACPTDYKLARQSDIDSGLAIQKTYFSYKFPYKYVEDQINTYLKKNANNIQNAPTEQCSIDQNAAKPEAIIVSPLRDKQYSYYSDLNIIVSATSDIGIKKVDIFVDNDGASTLVASLSSAPYQQTIRLSDYKEGNHRVTAVVTDNRDQQVTVEGTFSISKSAPSESPTPTKKNLSFPLLFEDRLNKGRGGPVITGLPRNLFNFNLQNDE